MKMEIAVAAVSMRTTLKYRRGWNKNGPTAKLLQSMMPQGPKKKGYRLYLEPGTVPKNRFTVPPAVRVAVQKAGYIITDYLAKKCVKAADKEQKNVYNIGKVIAHDQHAKNAFDNDPQLQNSKAGAIQVVISCHPYDIIGMSTGRDWDNQSCMRLKDFRDGFDSGQHHGKVEKDVSEGTLVAYAIRADDTNLQKPLARCLLKPFVSENGDVLYRRETRVYGNTVPGFVQTLTTFLRKINEHVPAGFYEMVDGLYNDGVGGSTNYVPKDPNSHDRITSNEVYEDSSLLIPFIKERVNAETPQETNDILQALNRHANDLHEDDINEIANLLRGNKGMASEYANILATRELTPGIAEIGRRAGFMDSFGEESRLHVYKEIPASMHSRFAQTSMGVLREYVLRMESSEHNVIDMRALATGLLGGGMPMPDESTFADCPNTKSWVFTMASAARFMPVIGFTDYEKRVHDIYALLEGTPKLLSESIMDDAQHIGPFSVGLALGVILDNADNYELSSDMIFSIPIEDAAPVVCKRRVFKTFDRLKNHNIRMFMEHIKLYVFQACMNGVNAQEQFKDVKQSVVDFMLEEPENFDSTRWNEYAIGALCKYHIPLLTQINMNVSGLGRDLFKVIPNVMAALENWNGAPIDPDENDFAELLLRTAVATGRLLDPPVTLSHKVAVEDMDNDAFYAWYSENKPHGFPQLGQMFGYMNYGVGPNAKRPDMLALLPLLTQSATDADANDDLAFARFSMQEIGRQNRLIIRTIKGLPFLGTAITQFTNYVESMEAEETEDEESAAKDLVYTDGLADELDADADDYDDRYASILDDARKTIEDRNYKKVEINSKLERIAQEILSQIGWDEDGNTDMRYFFSNYPEEELDDYEDKLADCGQEVADHLHSLIGSIEDYRSTAGYD